MTKLSSRIFIPTKTGGPVYPPYPSDASKYGLTILGWFAGHIAAGLAANPELVNKAFVDRLLAPQPSPEESSTEPEPLSSAAEESPMILGSLEYTFNTSTVEPIASADLEVNNSDQTLATKLWISKVTVDGIDATKAISLINERYGVYIQDKDDSSCSMTYNVIADSIDKGTYFEVPIEFISGGVPLAGGSPAQRVLMVVNKLVSTSEITPALLAEIAYLIANEMVHVREEIPIIPTPVPPPIEGVDAPSVVRMMDRSLQPMRVASQKEIDQRLNPLTNEVPPAE